MNNLYILNDSVNMGFIKFISYIQGLYAGFVLMHLIALELNLNDNTMLYIIAKNGLRVEQITYILAIISCLG